MAAEGYNRDLIARLDERVNALFRLFDEREKQVSTALASAEKATDKAEEAQQRVNAVQNEWRGALKDSTAEKATKEQVELVEDRVQSLEKANSAGIGKSAGTNSAQVLLFQLLPLLISAITMAVMFWKKTP